MDPGDAFSANIFKWDPPAPPPCRSMEPTPAAAAAAEEGEEPQPRQERRGGEEGQPRELGEVFSGYGVRYATVARLGELGFTASTLVGMTEGEVEEVLSALAHLFRWDLLLGERYGIKAALRAERRRLLDHHQAMLFLRHEHHHQPAAGVDEDARRRMLLLNSPGHLHHNLGGLNHALDALSQEGLSEEPVQQEREAAASGGEANNDDGRAKQRRSTKKSKAKKKSRKKNKKKKRSSPEAEAEEEEEEEEEDGWGTGGSEEGSERSVVERQREHPFIVTEPGEVARAKKNGLDYLFHLYEQCRHFLLQVQSLAKERGDKCPTKVTNQVFRYAKKVGASYINKPKMRHYVHCYALHCLDEEASNALRRAYKERGENVGAWRQACYKPLVAISARHGWDIDAVFNAHPRLSIWYVPTKLRQLCHLARSNAAAASTSVLGATSSDGLPPPPPMF
ncbi:floricaula/leafy homolog [Phoenix dactylifera]|uniref:Floricaula/leafy-like transcription factor n=1 Tax=Phoenix dactylifera TaxID=42345 RepID=A0A8B7BET3_PHODC|nr:floricaula/leafy homolog [Phoenix dactylifera]